ncbi:DUF349 domain-containing protein [Hymenobacter sp. UV11]|uniref:DUF349 domain-containing protein n=1 Tax=Hymenobacter sp. UV11 TaxID=1849735 RepID=UPI00106050A7|nr:DUF349 domain-containing protein [Hymenobacter sp. UV11]TDN39258.1 hypothetical protein A8B98_18535 [Hymenobacter sp. UV11]TFZ65661.1 DUF349 domain-containing protein [Hymenobacter sp. UV11]
MLPEETPTPAFTSPAHQEGDTPAPAADRLSIVEARLAEIRAQQSAGTAEPTPAAPALSDTPPAAAVPPGGGATQTEADPLLSEPGLAEALEDAPAAPSLAAAGAAPAPPTPTASPDPATPEAVAATETAQHVSAEVAAEHLSAPQARAVEHYGDAMTPAALDAEADPTPPALGEEAPVAQLASAEDLENAPGGVATLPTSATDTAATAHQAEIDHQHEAAGEESDDYVPETPAPDFAELDLESQAAHLIDLLRRPDARRNRQQIFELSRQYEANVAAARAASRQKLAEDANAPQEFSFQPPASQTELNKALQEFREGRARDAKAEDQNRGQNLARKQELLGQLRQLVESAETKDSSQKLKQLQADWKATGPVPQTDSQETWNTYHGLLDRYYANQGRFYELKELDRRRNQEAKEALVARAEALKDAPGINKALDELKKLHDDWKHIGPVPGEQREPLWQRFLAASEAVHLRRKEFVDVRSAQEQQNLTVKQALLERVLPFADFTTERVNEWRSRTDELQEIKKEWEAAGPVPRAQADQLNKQYWNAYKAFFNRKNEFFKSLDSEKNANLQAKYALIEQAEAAQQSADFDEARSVIIRVQKEWKDVGRVPEKQADKIWKRFRAACDSVFERPKQETRQREERQSAASAEQVTRLDKVGQQVAALSASTPGTLEDFRAIIADWQELDTTTGGTSDRGEEQFTTLMGKYLDQTAGITPTEKEDLLFQLEIARLKARPQAQQAFTRKETGLRRQIQELENDVATLQTNLDFFARSKNADQLRQEYQGRMEEARTRIEKLKKQLKQLRS